MSKLLEYIKNIPHAAMTRCWEQQGDSDSEQVFQQVVQYHLTLHI